MKKLYSDAEFEKSNLKIKFPLECYSCGITFFKTKNYIKNLILNKNNQTVGKFCSIKCVGLSATKIKHISCKNCNKNINKIPGEIKKSKSGNMFCNKSCAATYNNKHKTHGTRRSKLEIWLESKLKELYPNLEIDFNKKTAIDSELDIYIPSLKLAFELNGIFHYEPIFGKDKLGQIQNNDSNKFQKCIEKEISLCIIDASKLSYFKEKNCIPYLNIITNIINDKLWLLGSNECLQVQSPESMPLDQTTL